jgi:dipeptidyl aminopeptidase/acylaminoacyl peptidase
MVSDLTTGDVTPLTEPGHDGWNAQWSPSGGRIAFLSAVDGTATLFIKERGQAARAISRAHPWYVPWWIDADRVVYVAPLPVTQRVARRVADTPFLQHSSVPGAMVTVYRSKGNLSPVERQSISSAAVTEQSGTADQWIADLVMFNLATGKSTVLVPNIKMPYARPGLVAIAPDGKHIAYDMYQGRRTSSESNGVGGAMFTTMVMAIDHPSERTVVAEGTLGEVDMQTLTWSPDGRYLTWFANSWTDPGSLYVYDIRRKMVRHLLGNQGEATKAAGSTPVPYFNAGLATSAGYFSEATPVWLDAHTIVTKVYQGAAHTRPGGQLPTEIWAIDVVSGRTRRIGAIPDGTIYGILTRSASANAWVYGTELMLWVETSDHDDVLGAMDLTTGRYRAVTGGHYSFLSFSATSMPTAAPDGNSAVLVRQSATEPMDVWLQPLDGGAPQQLTYLNRGVSFKRFGSVKLLKYRAADGTLSRAALMLPLDYTPGHPVPLIVDTYVVSDWSFLVNQFAFEGGVDNPLLLTSRGYAVLFPDIPLGTGHIGGREITDAVIAGVDKAIRDGYADPERLGITGHSYGGYAVYSVIVRSNRFRAAVVRSGFPNWIATYLTMSTDGSSSWGIANAEGMRGPGGTLWAKRRQFIENSPIFTFDRITTPTLIVHGTRDHLADTNAKMAFVALRRLGKDVALALYSGEGHVQNGYAIPNQRDYMQREIAWFDRYLCPHRASQTSCAP